MTKISTINFDVQLDENYVPEEINWKASDGQDGGTCDATLISIWDKKEKNTLRIDLWTKEMTVDDMKLMLHQTLLTMSDTCAKAVGDQKLASLLRDFGYEFGEEAGLIEKGEQD